MKKQMKSLALVLALSLTTAVCVNAAANETNETTEAPETASEQTEENIANAVNAEQENAKEEVDTYEGQYTVEEVTIDDNGTGIYARIYMPTEQKDSYPAVIMSHGIGGTYENCEPYAKQFSANGVVAVAFDFQGGGPASSSDGEMVDMSTLTEAQDLEVVTDYVKQLDYVDPSHLFLLGESQGGFVSAYTAAQRPEDYKAIVLFYPAFVLQDDAWEKFPNGPEEAPEMEVIYGIEVGKQSYIDNMSFDIYDVIGNYTGDVLIVHGESDPVVPLSYSEKALDVYQSAELETIPGAEHGFRGDDIEKAGTLALDFVLAHVG
jgi:dienelactone hydrolase